MGSNPSLAISIFKKSCEYTGVNTDKTPYLAVKKEAEMPENRQIDEQRIISVFSILEWAEAFIVDRKARGLSPNTIAFY